MSVSLFEIDALCEELITLQRKKLLQIANDLGLKLTPEDLLNPHDFEALLSSSRFQFEDGVLAGFLSAQMAIRNRFDLD